MTRDPRAMMYAKMLNDPNLNFNEEASALCESLTEDLNVIDHKMPKYHFHTLRFEEFQLKPNEEVYNYLKGMHSLSVFCSKPDPVLHPNPGSDVIDTWKLKLSMEQIMTIEDKCGTVLNRLEYPIYGSNFLTD